jgi:hypothetical protein
MVVVLNKLQNQPTVRPKKNIHFEYRRDSNNSNQGIVQPKVNANLTKPSEQKTFKNFATIADQYVITNEYNLYNPTPTLDAVKQKYKSYLGWLSENANISDMEQHDLVKRLNWYNYEKSINSKNESDCFRFLKNITKEKASSGLDSYRQKM